MVWLGDGAHGADPGLAQFAVVTIGLALAALVVFPAAYLLFPVLLSVDLVPHGLRRAVGSKVTTISARDLLRHMVQDFDNAVDHAAQEAKDAAAARRAKPSGEPPPGESAEPVG